MLLVLKSLMGMWLFVVLMTSAGAVFGSQIGYMKALGAERCSVEKSIFTQGAQSVHVKSTLINHQGIPINSLCEDSQYIVQCVKALLQKIAGRLRQLYTEISWKLR